MSDPCPAYQEILLRLNVLDVLARVEDKLDTALDRNRLVELAAELKVAADALEVVVEAAWDVLEK